LDGDVRRDRRALHDWQKLVALIVTRITRLFQTGRASPLAVGFENQSLTHHLAEVVITSSLDPCISTCVMLTRPSKQLHRMISKIPSINGTYEECVSPLLMP
jgi:hypothetical protein